MMHVKCMAHLAMAIMGAVPQPASANTFNTLMRSIGSSVSAAVIGVVLAQLTTDFGGYALPSEDGFRIAMLIGSGVDLAAAVVASLPREGGSTTGIRRFAPGRLRGGRSQGLTGRPSPGQGCPVQSRGRTTCFLRGCQC